MTLSPRLKRQKREKLLAKYGRGCWLCGKEIREDQMVTLDHVRPRAKGGSHSLANLRLAHRSCNSRRGTKWMPVLKLTADMRVRAGRPKATAMTIRMSKHTAFGHDA
jgi:5-methylcytosine-specific restriction endonuclease McrA